MKIKWENPKTKEKLIHQEKDGKRELLYGIYGKEGGKKGHAVWRGGVLDYHRDDNNNILVDRARDRRDNMSRETSRRGIDESITTTKKKYEEIGEEFKKDVKTKIIISDAARAAHVEGTDEGMKKIKKAVESAGIEADKKFKKDDEEQKTVTKSEATPREKKLQDMTQKTKSDIQKTRQAHSKAEVDGSKKYLKEAESAGAEDAKFTEASQKKQEKDRKSAEQDATAKGREMKSNPVKFKH